MDYLTLKWLHVLSSTVLFGTGLGTAWYMLVASLGRDARVAAAVARQVVRAAWIFTGTTVVVQPLTGWLMARQLGLPLATPWIAWSIGLYLLAGACWLPVVWIQIRLRDIAQDAADAGRPLPPAYFRWLRVWVLLGIPAFFGLVVVFWLMVAKPS